MGGILTCNTTGCTLPRWHPGQCESLWPAQTSISGYFLRNHQGGGSQEEAEEVSPAEASQAELPIAEADAPADERRTPGGLKMSEQEAVLGNQEQVSHITGLLRELGIKQTNLLKPMSLLELGFSETKIDELADKLLEGFDASKPKGKELYSCAWPHPFEDGEVLYGGGYSGYGRLPQGVRLNGRAQASVTFMATAANFYVFAKVLPHLDELLWRTQQQVRGRKLHRMHVLLQGPSGAQSQATFGWHRDDETETDTVVSVVFLLRGGPSSISMANGSEYTYSEKGDGCMFPSELYHRTVAAPHPRTLKVGLFFERR